MKEGASVIGAIVLFLLLTTGIPSYVNSLQECPIRMGQLWPTEHLYDNDCNGTLDSVTVTLVAYGAVPVIYKREPTEKDLAYWASLH